MKTFLGCFSKILKNNDKNIFVNDYKIGYNHFCWEESLHDDDDCTFLFRYLELSDKKNNIINEIVDYGNNMRELHGEIYRNSYFRLNNTYGNLIRS